MMAKAERQPHKIRATPERLEVRLFTRCIVTPDWTRS